MVVFWTLMASFAYAIGPFIGLLVVALIRQRRALRAERQNLITQVRISQGRGPRRRG